MNAVETVLTLVIGVPLYAAALIGGLVAGLFIVMTVYAFVKPHVSYLIDAYIDWYERRTL